MRRNGLRIKCKMFKNSKSPKLKRDFKGIDDCSFYFELDRWSMHLGIQLDEDLFHVAKTSPKFTENVENFSERCIRLSIRSE